MKPQASLRERGIQKPQGNKSRKQVIGEWLELVNYVEAITSDAFASLTMTHLKLVQLKKEPPPCEGTEHDRRIDDFAKAMASMIFNVFVEIGAPSDQELWEKLLGGTLIECIGPRFKAPPSKADAYPVDVQRRQAERAPPKNVFEMESEEEFHAWLTEREARDHRKRSSLSDA